MKIKSEHAKILSMLYRSETIETLPYIPFQELLRAKLVTEVAPPYLSGTTPEREPRLTPEGLEKCRELFGPVAYEPKTAKSIRYKEDD